MKFLGCIKSLVFVSSSIVFSALVLFLMAPCAAQSAEAGFPGASPSPRAEPARWSGEAIPFTIKRGLVYKPRTGFDLRLDLYLPRTRGPHPVVVVFHGGGWQLGSRFIGDGPFVARLFAREGIAAASVSYRLAPRHPHPAQFEDAQAAVRWLRKNAAEFDLDPDRIGAAGASAGGHIAALLGTKANDSKRKETELSAAVQCVVTFSAPLDLEFTQGKIITPLQQKLIADFLGVAKNPEPKDLQAAVAKGIDASPKNAVSPDDAPFLIVQGDGDPIVPLEQAQVMAEALAKSNVPHQLLVLPDLAHGSYLPQILSLETARTTTWWPKLHAFVAEHLVGRKSPAPIASRPVKRPETRPAPQSSEEDEEPANPIR